VELHLAGEEGHRGILREHTHKPEEANVKSKLNTRKLLSMEGALHLDSDGPQDQQSPDLTLVI
jgi:hypothetical protein